MIETNFNKLIVQESRRKAGLANATAAQNDNIVNGVFGHSWVNNVVNGVVGYAWYIVAVSPSGGC
jgi:hypothetical protein